MPRFIIKVGDKYAMYSTIVDDIIWHFSSKEVFLNGIKEEYGNQGLKSWQPDIDALSKEFDSTDPFPPNDIEKLPGKLLKMYIRRYKKKKLKHG